MRRALLAPLTLLLSALAACQAPQTAAPEEVASTPVLAEVVGEIEVARLDRDAGVGFDRQLRAIDNDEAIEAQYARAELAWSCQDPMLWQGLHEELARLGHEPSFTRLVERALEREQWERVMDLVAMQRDRAGSGVAAERLDALELRAARALWHARGDKQDYELVEHLLEAKLASARDQLPVQLELIELYVEYVGLGPDDGFDDGPNGLLLAQLGEQRARELLAKQRSRSAELEYLAGFIRDLEGDREAAVTAWREALRVDPDFVEPRLWLGFAALEAGDFELAKDELHRFLDGHPDHEDARYTLALATRRAEAARAAAEVEVAAQDVEANEVAAPAAH